MPTPPLLRGLGSLLAEIPLDTIHAKPDTPTTLEDVVTLTSYNLLHKSRKAMIVPGSPSIWTPGALPKHVKPDSGKYFMDPNRHVFPHCPLEPLFRALLTTHPDFNLANTDLITDRRNLRVLLDFISGVKAEFRIEVEVVKSTILFSCWTPRSVSFSPPGRFSGYGHEFEKATTQQPGSVRGSTGHFRVISYVLGGVKIVLRFEVDGCVGTGATRPPRRPPPTMTHTPTSIAILPRGHLAPSSHIIEIKTGPVGKTLSTSRNIAQLWFAQTPILCTGHYGKDGVFWDVGKTDVMQEGRLAQWEEENREKLRRLVALVGMIAEVAKGAPKGKCAVVLSQGSSALKVYDVGPQYAKGLPADLLEMWKN